MKTILEKRRIEMFKYYWYIVGTILITIGFCLVFSEPILKLMGNSPLVPLGFLITGLLSLACGILLRNYRE